ncbi:TIGR03862 family flavoprotein [Rhizobium sp. TRM95111]|uniref:TIGR03862 family flavoprotein n=1 Tax=Rhizobium alarense TaxID=2846851 RepID=UPI001F393264|nr:TIGR03862 family flavoprotein [Rhizobium alarense]MCF3641368.1 TIGR03862 family flavoprotein [Rhizobium alarense]
MAAARIAIIGGGPAGLMAAETLAAAGCAVTVYDAMPTVGRKFLLAGKTGLNLTHAEDYVSFRGRFGAAGPHLGPALDAFPPDALRAWADALGAQTFVGSSGRVFPKAMKASPLLRAWVGRLEESGVRIEKRHRWTGFSTGRPLFATPDSEKAVDCDAILLALGGASWPRLGSDGRWVESLEKCGVPVRRLQPANCGFDVAWSGLFRDRHAGAPVKSVTAMSDAGSRQGEFVISRSGIEGSLVYTHAAALRDRLAREGSATLTLDLVPGQPAERLAEALARQSAGASLSTRLRKAANLTGVKAALVREIEPDAGHRTADALAALLKALPLAVDRPRPIEEAISSAGGIAWDGLDDRYMLAALPGVFAAGEMLDWEAPTGGYLLTACLATGRAAANGILDWLAAP